MEREGEIMQFPGMTETQLVERRLEMAGWLSMERDPEMRRTIRRCMWRIGSDLVERRGFVYDNGEHAAVLAAAVGRTRV